MPGGLPVLLAGLAPAQRAGAEEPDLHAPESAAQGATETERLRSGRPGDPLGVGRVRCRPARGVERLAELRAGNPGGGIFNDDGSVTLDGGSTVSGNTAEIGGGIFTGEGSVTLDAPGFAAATQTDRECPPRWAVPAPRGRSGCPTGLRARVAELEDLTARLREAAAARDELAAAQLAARDAQIAALAALVEDLRRRLDKDSLLTEQPRVFSQLGTLAGVLGCTVTAHDQRAGAGPFGARGAAGGCAGEDREPV